MKERPRYPVPNVSLSSCIKVADCCSEDSKECCYLNIFLEIARMAEIGFKVKLQLHIFFILSYHIIWESFSLYQDVSHGLDISLFIIWSPAGLVTARVSVSYCAKSDP